MHDDLIEIGTIARLRLQPGDVLVIRVNSPVSEAVVAMLNQRIKQVLAQAAPGLDVPVIVTHDMDLSVLSLAEATR